MILAAFCLTYAGFACLALAMDRHFEAVFDRAPRGRQRQLLRLGGTGALLVSMWACVQHYGWAYGLTEWVGMLALAGLLLIWIQTYRPRTALVLGLACVAAAPVLVLV